MVKCRECGNLKAIFEAKVYCGGNPEEAINDGDRDQFDGSEFSHFECDSFDSGITTVKDLDKERKCEAFELGKRLA